MSVIRRLVSETISNSFQVMLGLAALIAFSGTTGSCWATDRDGLSTDDVTLRGQIKDAAGNPYANYQIDVLHNGVFLDTTTTNTNGNFDWSCGPPDGFHAFTLRASAGQQPPLDLAPLYRTRVAGLHQFPGAPEAFCMSYKDIDAQQEVTSWFNSADVSGLNWWQYALERLSFINEVEAETATALRRKFGNQVAFTLQQPACSPNANRVQFEKWFTWGGVQGYSSADYMNQSHSDLVHISIRAHGQWDVMFTTRMSPDVLAEDAGRALGNTISHEVGHSVGLVLGGLRTGMGVGSHIPDIEPTNGLRSYRTSIMLGSVSQNVGAEVFSLTDEQFQVRKWGRIPMTFDMLSRDYLSAVLSYP